MAYIFKLLTSEWNTLTDAEKIAMFEGTNYLKPTVEQLKTLGEFNCMIYSDTEDSKFMIKGVPKDQLVIPNGLISTLNFSTIKHINLINDIAENGVIKLAITLDKSTYYTFNFTTSTWDIISTTAEDVLEKGLTPQSLASISEDSWTALLKMGEGSIGFAYLLSTSAMADSVKVDTLIMTVTMNGMWKHTTDYEYGYATNRSILITLKSDGDFKINYPDNDGDISSNMNIATITDIDNMLEGV